MKRYVWWRRTSLSAMREYIGLFLLALVYSSCSSARDQVVDTRFADFNDSTEFHVSGERDITVVYSFWGDHGRMAFIVQNNSDRAIYIDWFKSSMVLQGVRHPYWKDLQVMSSNGVSQALSMTKRNNQSPFSPFDLSSLSIEAHSSLTVVSKQERISFLPPKARLVVETPHNLVDSIFTKNWEEREVQASYNPNRSTMVKVKTFDRSNSPLAFRNYMSWSFTENFENEFSVDHEFWVEKVTSMTHGQFKGLVRNEEGQLVPGYPYRSPKRFYIQFTQ